MEREFTRITLAGDLNWDWDLDSRDLGGLGISFGFQQGGRWGHGNQLISLTNSTS